jgi:hypothetical protein
MLNAPVVPGDPCSYHFQPVLKLVYHQPPPLFQNRIAMDTFLTESEIKSLLVRERYYRDTNQWEKLRSSYHPDASKTHIDITW